MFLLTYAMFKLTIQLMNHGYKPHRKPNLINSELMVERL